MKSHVLDFWNDTQGQDLVEYALGVAMVAIMAVGAPPPLGATVGCVFNKIANVVTSAVQ